MARRKCYSSVNYDAYAELFGRFGGGKKSDA